jgi:hypothetical protein
MWRALLMLPVIVGIFAYALLPYGDADESGLQSCILIAVSTSIHI